MQSSASESSATLAGAVSAATANEQPGLSRKAKTTNVQLRAISRAVAKMVAEEDLRQYVYRRAMEKFDGETNVLWMQLNERTGHNLPQAMQQANGKPWTTLVKSNLAPGKAQSLAPRLGDVIDRAGQLLGGPVHLYWAFAERFDADSRAPLVTFTPLGVDADKITDVVAYDASGESHVVNEAIAKKRPVVVLAGNERVDHGGMMNGTGKKGDVEKDGCGGQIGIIGAPGIDPPGPNGAAKDGCGGDDGDGDDSIREFRLQWVQFFDDSEGFLKGDPEFWARFVHYDDGSAVEYWKYEVRPQISSLEADLGIPVEIDQKVFNWLTEDYATYFVKWYEYDGDTGSVQVNLGLKSFQLPGDNGTVSAGVTLGFQDEDDMLGAATVHLVELEDGEAETYNTNAPNFTTVLPN